MSSAFVGFCLTLLDFACLYHCIFFFCYPPYVFAMILQAGARSGFFGADFQFVCIYSFLVSFIGGYARKINAEKCILHLLHDPTLFALYPTRPESSFGVLQREFKKNMCSSRIYYFLLTRTTLLHNPRHCFLVSFERSLDEIMAALQGLSQTSQLHQI